MSKPLSRPVSFRTMSVKGLTQQLDGTEKPYPVYYLGSAIKLERPTQPGQQYRWLTS